MILKKRRHKRRPRTATLAHLARQSTSPEVSLLLLLLLLMISALALIVSSGAASVSHDYYASLPKLGHLRGLRLAGEPNVVAFLNVPYAGPPVALLRFMPPAATGSAQNQQQSNTERRILFPALDRRVPVRTNHRQFGRDCVRLPDWIETGNSKSNSFRLAQAEDCLNLNVFVPLNETTNGQLVELMSQQQQIKIAPGNSTHLASDKHQVDAPAPINQDKPLFPIADSIMSQYNMSMGNKSSPGRLPVLVVFHGNEHGSLENKPNSLSYMPLVRKSQSLVITFNYRVGLLGFLPYVDIASDTTTTTRNNHAIWDQIGLLDWLRRNVAAFNGDPTNVTLLAADNRAALFIQLLCMTPHSKGLFKRAILVQDDRLTSKAERFSELARLASDGRESRRKLAANLRQIVQQMTSNETTSNINQPGDNLVSEFILRANLSQLAEVDLQLKQNQSPSQQATSLATGPALDDKFLFPQLSYLIKTHNFTGPNASDHFLPRLMEANNFSFVSWEVNYCLYTRHLYEPATRGQFDELSLLANKAQFNITSPAINRSWHRESVQNSIESKSNSRRLMIASNFYHLQNLQLLTNFLRNTSGNDTHDTSAAAEEPEEDFDEMIKKQQQNRRILFNALGSPNLRRSIEPTNTTDLDRAVLAKRSLARDHLGQLLKLMSSFDLMLAHFHHQPQQSSQNEPEVLIGKEKLTRYSKGSSSKEFLDWLRWLDLAYTSEFEANEASLLQFCDIFTPKQDRKTNYYVFSIDTTLQNNLIQSGDFNEAQSDRNWLVEFTDQSSIVGALSSFSKFGDLSKVSHSDEGKYRGEPWPKYDTLDRLTKQFFVSSTRGELKSAPESVENSLAIHLSLVPYLEGILNNSDFYLVSDSRASLDRLLNCLEGIEVMLVKRGENNKFQLDNSDRIRCLQNLTSHYRGQLRQYASDDLEPLLKFIERQLEQEQQLSSHHSSSSISITTRNLLAKDVLGFEQQAANQSDEITLHNTNGTLLVTYVSPRSSNSSSSFETAEGVIDFLDRTYKKAMGKAWPIVIGTGLSLLMLNILIVIIIGFTRRRQRRSDQQQDEQEFSPSLSLAVAPANLNLKRSSIKGHSNDTMTCNGFHSMGNKTTKQLKFDLTGTPDGAAEHDKQEMELPFTHLAAHNNPEGIYLYQSDSDQQGTTTQQVTDCNGNLVLNVSTMLNNSNKPLQYQEQNYKDRFGGTLHRKHCHAHHYSTNSPAENNNNNSSSPLQTHSTATTTDTYSRILSYENDYPIAVSRPCPHHGEPNNQKSQNQQAGTLIGGIPVSQMRVSHQLYSATSPGSSTTLSVTPNQYNSSNVNTIDLSASNAPSYQMLEPITFFYPTNNDQKNFEIFSPNGNQQNSVRELDLRDLPEVYHEFLVVGNQNNNQNKQA